MDMGGEMAYGDSRQNSRSNKVALFVAGYLDSTTVQDAFGSFINAGLDQITDPLFGLGRDDGSKIRVRKVS